MISLMPGNVMKLSGMRGFISIDTDQKEIEVKLNLGERYFNLI
jgi:hypothetical protein